MHYIGTKEQLPIALATGLLWFLLFKKPPHAWATASEASSPKPAASLAPGRNCRSSVTATQDRLQFLMLQNGALKAKV